MEANFAKLLSGFTITSHQTITPKERKINGFFVHLFYFVRNIEDNDEQDNCRERMYTLICNYIGIYK